MPKESSSVVEGTKIYEHLKKVRESKTVEIKPTVLLRKELTGLDGVTEPLRLRYYQVQGIYHLLMVNRIVLGDGTGLGKTAQALGALCYIWERDPEVKAIVVCPKSAIGQWASEISRFTIGVKCFQASGSLTNRKDAYLAWRNHQGPSILVVNYHSVVRDWDQGITKDPPPPGSKPGTTTVAGRGFLDSLTSSIKTSVVFDECFDYHTPVVLADGSTELIGRIATGKLPVSVLSWDWDLSRVVAKRVVGWYRNPVDLGAPLLKFRFRFAGASRVTESHNFYRVDGTKVLAKSLGKGSATAFLSMNTPSKDQEQLVLGSLLGDAGLSNPNRNLTGVAFGQSSKQECWINFKRKLLEPLGVSNVSRYQTEFQSGKQQMVRFTLHGNEYLTSIFSKCCAKSGKKVVTRRWLDLIEPLGLAVWYADDGSINEHTCNDGSVSRIITLHTEGYTKEENDLLAGWLLQKWGVNAEVKPVFNKKRGSRYYYLYLANEAANRFLALLPGGFPGVEYKFPTKEILCLDHFDTRPRSTLIEDEVLAVNSWVSYEQPKLKNRYVYDLEVEGTHNYFANGSLVSNCTAFKNPTTKTHQTCKFLSLRAKRVWGLTATLLQNHLMEGFGIYKVIRPETFGTKNSFLNVYCVTEMQRVKGGGKIPIVVGYRNLEHFRQTIDPYFYGRAKQDVSTELPALTTREIVCELSKLEEKKYAEALSGILELGDGEFRDYKDTKQLTSLIYIQEICNSLALLKFEDGGGADFEGRSSKESALVDLLSEEFDGEKVIIYTRFASHIPRLQAILSKEGIRSVFISGSQNDKERKKAQDQFQDLSSKVKVIIITDAGSEAINLQAASAMVLFDSPWSWGRYVQLLGRMVRIGSPHPRVLAVHLITRRPGLSGKKAETIDSKVVQKLRRKKGLIDQVIGEAAVGALKFDRSENDIKDLLQSLRDTSSK